MALRAACSGIEIKYYTHTHVHPSTQPPNSAVKVRPIIWYNARSQCTTNQSPNAPQIRVRTLHKRVKTLYKRESKCSINQSPKAQLTRVQRLNESESKGSTNQSPNAPQIRVQILNKSESKRSTNQSPNAPQIRAHY